MKGGKKVYLKTKSQAKKAKLNKPAAKAVAKIAKRVLNKSSETKYVAQANTNGAILVYGSTVPTSGIPQIWDVCPDIAEGSSQIQREGVKIQPVKHRVDVDLRFNHTMADISAAGTLDDCSWDVDVHVFYGFVRRYKNAGDVQLNASTLLNQLLDDGQGNTVPFNGDQWIDFLSINKEVFNLKHKKFRMYRALGEQNTATLAGGLTTYFPQEIRKRFSLTFKPPKTLLYDEGDLLPQNYAPVVIVGYQHRDWTQAANAYSTGTPTVLNRPALMMQLYEHMWFKDI